MKRTLNTRIISSKNVKTYNYNNISSEKGKGEMKIKNVIVHAVVLVTFLFSYGQEGAPSSETNVVAVAIGYENVVQLPSGELIRTFPTSLPPNSETNCRAVLFSVLKPEEWRGKNFLLQRSGCNCRYCRVNPAPQLYRFGRKYSFGKIDKVKRILFDVGFPSDMRALSFPHDWGDEIEVTHLSGTVSNACTLVDSVDMDNMELEYLHVPNGCWRRPLSEVWNADIFALKNTRLPPMECTDMTLGEILERVKKTCQFLYLVEIDHGPSDASWSRRYSLSLGGTSVLDALIKIGELQDVRLYVGLALRSSATFVYRVPVDSVFVDWGGSVYTRTLPAMEFHNVTLKQLAYELFDRTFKKWYDSGEVSEATFSFEIENKQTLKRKRSFAFAGINLRDAIREICCSYGVRYDFRRHAWED